jgi:ESS family glutamate:Na+ symporter
MSDVSTAPLEVDVLRFLILSIFVLWFGQAVNKRVRFLAANNIPIAVTGGLLFSVAVAVFVTVTGRELVFDMRLRDLLLLIFFSTIGLGAKLRMLAAGGKALALLLVAAATFLVIQNVTGVLIALGFGVHPGFGLFAGSVSFAGGHGTAIAWGAEAAAAGFPNAATLGIAFATVGLIAGGLLGGPLAGRLIMRHGLKPAAPANGDAPVSAAGDTQEKRVRVPDILGTILMLAVCVAVGDSVNRFLFSAGVLLPGFLTAMVVGIVITNLADVRKIQINTTAVSMTSDVALLLFLSMSLMSMDLLSLRAAATPILITLVLQSLVITLFSVHAVFRLMGRDYDAAVISGGFVGLGLGATPVAIANMHAVTEKYGLSPKAFLVVPLVGAFFIDVVNALVIKLFIALPMFQPVPPG